MNCSFCFPYFWFAGCGNLSTSLFWQRSTVRWCACSFCFPYFDIHLYMIKSMNISIRSFFQVWSVWQRSRNIRDWRQLVQIESELRCHHLNWMGAVSPEHLGTQKKTGLKLNKNCTWSAFSSMIISCRIWRGAVLSRVLLQELYLQERNLKDACTTERSWHLHAEARIWLDIQIGNNCSISNREMWYT